MMVFKDRMRLPLVRLLPVLLTLLCLAAAPAGAQSSPAWNIDVLLQKMAAAKPGRARFVEEKHIALLERPVMSSGELRYRAPDLLEKRTLQPRAESMVIQGDVLSIERGGKKHVVQLAQYPELQAMAASLRGLLGGNRAILEQFFRLDLSGSARQWRLDLKPLALEVGRNVHLIRLAGQQGRLEEVEIILTDGDRTLMHIQLIQPLPASAP